MRKLILLVVGLVFYGTSYAEDNSIYVITNKPISVSETEEWSASTSPAYQELQQITTEVEGRMLESAIRNVKSTICSSVGDAAVKVYFTFDASAKVFGIGTSTGAGIEVTFDCKSS
ncbi:MAG: hypothetical protein WEB64_10710 [Marinobacter sp.]|uniref:hypothetical protein n=1 Tax=Marinobacter sp. TaxID=50741 RepID=UPI0034A03D55